MPRGLVAVVFAASEVRTCYSAAPPDDTLDGRDGTDELEGGGGSDILLGGNGADSHLTLDGRQDRLVCGAGMNTREADLVDLIDATCE